MVTRYNPKNSDPADRARSMYKSGSGRYVEYFKYRDVAQYVKILEARIKELEESIETRDLIEALLKEQG